MHNIVRKMLQADKIIFKNILKIQTYLLRRFLAYFGWLKVIRHRLAAQLMLQAMT